MSDRSARPDLVYVPRRPGRLISPEAPGGSGDGDGDDIDDVLDDLFGTDDPGGPSITDAILVVAGLGAIAFGVSKSTAGFIAVGVALIGLGIILPIRTTVRRLGERRRRRRAAASIGDGLALRQDHPTLRRIAELHESTLERSLRLAPAARTRVGTVAHDLVVEVAILLDGGLPAGAAEIEYVELRSRSLAELFTTLDDPRVRDGDDIARRTMSEARIEVERISGTSAVAESANLRDDLLADGDDV